jgi:hypothetical protein
MTLDQPLLRRTLARMDEAWATFDGAARSLKVEQLSARNPDGGWNRKQMLAHIAVWHDLTAQRLLRFGETGEPPDPAGDEDAVNARAARGADGRSTGEVVLSIEDSFVRLRREVAKLTDEQLAANDGWAVAVIAGNTFDHYAEHLGELRKAP